MKHETSIKYKSKTNISHQNAVVCLEAKGNCETFGTALRGRRKDNVLVMMAMLVSERGRPCCGFTGTGWQYMLNINLMLSLAVSFEYAVADCVLTCVSNSNPIHCQFEPNPPAIKIVFRKTQPSRQSGAEELGRLCWREDDDVLAFVYCISIQ